MLRPQTSKLFGRRKNKHDDESQQFHLVSSHLMKKTLKQLISGLLIFSLRGNWYGFTLDLGEQGLVDPKQKEPVGLYIIKGGMKSYPVI